VLAALALAAGPLARAQGTPAAAEPPMSLIVPTPEGGTADRVGRHVAGALGEILGEPIQVRNMPGLHGALGTSAIAAAPSNGRVIGLAISNAMIAARLLSQAGVSYQPLEDFEWLAILGSYSNALVVPGREPSAGFKEWIERARTSPVPLVVGTFGVGSAGHLAVAYLQIEQKLNVVSRPLESLDIGYREMSAGTLDGVLDGVPNASVDAPRTGHRILAVTGAVRESTLPASPCFGELWPGQSFPVWVGLVTPKGLSPNAHSRLASAIGVLLLEPRHAENLRKEGVTLIGHTGQKARAFVEDEMLRTARLIARLSEGRPR